MKFMAKLRWEGGSLNTMIEAANVLEALDKALSDPRVADHKAEIGYVWINKIEE